MQKKITKEYAVRVMERVAREEGVSVETVRKEIDEAMRIGMQSSDPAVQAKWKEIPCEGERPTPEELLVFIAEQNVSK